jgi:spore photoproduct lyase
LIYGEFIRGLDNKMRYFKPIRIEMYRNLFTQIRKYVKDVFVYLCMENRDVWERSFGFAPKDTTQLSTMLDERARKLCWT